MSHVLMTKQNFQIIGTQMHSCQDLWTRAVAPDDGCLDRLSFCLQTNSGFPSSTAIVILVK